MNKVSLLIISVSALFLSYAAAAYLFPDLLEPLRVHPLAVPLSVFMFLLWILNAFFALLLYGTERAILVYGGCFILASIVHLLIYELPASIATYLGLFLFIAIPIGNIIITLLMLLSKRRVPA